MMQLIYFVIHLYTHNCRFILKLIITFIVLFPLSSNVFSQDDININPEIWRPYNNIDATTNVASAIMDQYGNITPINNPDILTIEVPQNADNARVVPIRITGQLKAKSIAVFRDATPYVTVAIINVLTANTIDYGFRLNLGKYGKTEITVIVEADDGNFYRVKRKIGYFVCSDGWGAREKDELLYSYRGYHDNYANQDHLRQTKPNSIKARAILEDNIITAKILATHHTITSYDAQRYDVKENFIKHIAAYVKQKKVCEIFVGQAIAKNPYFRCSFDANGINEGDNLKATYTDSNGKKSRAAIITKNAPFLTSGH